MHIIISNVTKGKDCTEKNRASIHFAIFQICSSLLKSLSSINIYGIICEVLLDVESFKDIDKCTEMLINELVYDGYSIRYLQDWYKNVVVEVNKEATEFIAKINDFYRESENIEVFFTVKNDCEGIPIQCISNDIRIDELNKGEVLPEIASHLSFNEINRVYRANISGMDEYKAANDVVNAFESYFLIVNLMDGKEFKINEKVSSKNLGVVNNFNVQGNDTKIVLPNIDRKEKNDLQDFLTYRNQVYVNNLIVGDIASIERSLNILKNDNYDNEENRLINYWNVLEYVLSYYSGESIISKVRFIIPKLVCLYYLKDKLNIFWNTLAVSRGYGDEVKEFIDNSKKDDFKYDIKKLIENIEKAGMGLSECFGTNKHVLTRKYFEVGGIIAGKVDLRKELENLHKRIEYDIVRIYRTRNILVHSGSLTNTNIVMKNARLMLYISNLLGVILHYKMKNSQYSISEILCTVPETYNYYLDSCTKDGEKYKAPIEEIFKPQYLFM